MEFSSEDPFADLDSWNFYITEQTITNSCAYVLYLLSLCLYLLHLLECRPNTTVFTFLLLKHELFLGLCGKYRQKDDKYKT